MSAYLKDIYQIVDRQNQWRGRECINLIASENTPSPAVRELQNNDFMGRYAEGHPNTPAQINRYYQGTQYIDQIETMAEAEIKDLFQCRQADVRPYSGNNANTAIAMGYLRGGDTVIVNSTDAGGHISHNYFGIMGRRIQIRGQVLKPGKENSINLFFFPLTEDHYHIDVPKTIELIEKVNPTMLVMGKSLYLFPDPVKELAPICREKGIPILYDGAHVLGLIAGGQFQQPLAEGATWLTGSTHKTFPGPQRGVILGNMDEEDEKKYWNAADRGVFPGTSSNHHLYSLPALLAATREMKLFGREYAAQICKNIIALAQSLEANQIKVEAKEFGYTRSHQIAVNVSNYGGGEQAAIALEKNDIICNYNMLPGDTNAKNPSGLRIGAPEMTRFGMKEADFGYLGELMAEAIKGKTIKDKVNQLRSKFLHMQYV
ncbi:MAG: serine hydroxymethyltransferase [Candidatus Delongbacteria bacterium]|nr:serine hydroxymethyltransferase [Candidatus Delongbacteria bacterium]